MRQAALKTASGATRSRVRIPALPPYLRVRDGPGFGGSLGALGGSALGPHLARELEATVLFVVTSQAGDLIRMPLGRSLGREAQA
jgi:hypothetical protein